MHLFKKYPDQKILDLQKTRGGAGRGGKLTLIPLMLRNPFTGKIFFKNKKIGNNSKKFAPQKVEKCHF